MFLSVKLCSFGWDYISALTSFRRLIFAEIAVESENVLDEMRGEADRRDPRSARGVPC